jgi:hypothetical protein
MSKKQVLLLSSVVALPAIGLLVALVFGALADGGKMFSGMMTVIVAVTGLLVLFLGLSPFAIMAFYPTTGFASFAPQPQAGAAPAAPPRPATEDDDGEAEDDDGFESDEFDDGGSFEDDGDEELYEDDEEFEDDEDWG